MIKCKEMVETVRPKEQSGVVEENRDSDTKPATNSTDLPLPEWRPHLIWPNIIGIFGLHFLALYCFCAYVTVVKIKTVLLETFIAILGGLGVTGGAHRLWTHRSYKASAPVQIFLMICFSIAGQNQIYDWVRDHRVHHKYSETDADPHNSNRGFFFSHVGWLMQKKHPQVIKKGKTVDMSDITEDPFIQFHHKYFTLLKLIFCFAIPICLPVYLWDERWIPSIGAALVRYTLGLNFTWSVNSFAHIWGYRPYDKRISPAENYGVSFVALGEGWHNYHHCFPWDYRASEYGYALNLTTLVIDSLARLGLVWDRKTPSTQLVSTMASKYGDHQHDS